jgi:hypothetical protein
MLFFTTIYYMLTQKNIMNLSECKTVPNYNSNYQYSPDQFTAECPDFTLKMTIDDA